jgi:hypothetical protein
MIEHVDTAALDPNEQRDRGLDCPGWRLQSDIRSDTSKVAWS